MSNTAVVRTDGHLFDSHITGDSKRVYSEVVGFMADGPVTTHSSFHKDELNTVTAVMEFPVSSDEPELNKKLKRINGHFFHNNKKAINDSLADGLENFSLESHNGTVGVYSSDQREDCGLWVDRHFIVAKDCAVSKSHQFYAEIQRCESLNNEMFREHGITAADYIIKGPRFHALSPVAQRELRESIITWKGFFASNKIRQAMNQQTEHVLAVMNQFLDSLDLGLKATESNTKFQIENRFVWREDIVVFLKGTPSIQNDTSSLFVRETPLSGFTIHVGFKTKHYEQKMKQADKTRKQKKPSERIDDVLLGFYTGGMEVYEDIIEHDNVDEDEEEYTAEVSREDRSESKGDQVEALKHDLQALRVTKALVKPPLRFDTSTKNPKVPFIDSKQFILQQHESNGDDKHLLEYFQALGKFKSVADMSFWVFPTELFDDERYHARSKALENDADYIEAVVGMIKSSAPGKFVLIGTSVMGDGTGNVAYTHGDSTFFMKNTIGAICTFFSLHSWGTVYKAKRDLKQHYAIKDKTHSKITLKPIVVLYGKTN